MLSGPRLGEIHSRKRAKRMTKLPLNLKDWPLLWKELYEERAGIIEAEARLPRDVAQKLAEEDIRKQAAS